MFGVELNPVPSPEWQNRYYELTHGDDWLRRKTDRTRRLKEHEAYLAAHWPEIGVVDPGLVIDIGPGPGELLELARAYGHDILGIDAPTGAGGMGDAYLAFSRLMHERQEIPCKYVGLQAWLAEDLSKITCTAALINSRGSWEQAFAHRMKGEPHDRHHRADKLEWVPGGDTVDEFEHVLRQFKRLLRPGGVLLINSNGAKNDWWYDNAIRSAADRIGTFRLVEHDPPRIHKWVLE